MNKNTVTEQIQREVGLYSFPKDVTVKVTTRDKTPWYTGLTSYSQAVRETIVRHDRQGDPVYRREILINVNPKRIRSSQALENALDLLRQALVDEAGGILEL